MNILEAAQRIMSDTHGLTLESFAASRVVRQVVERNLEVIGEAAKHLPEATTAHMPGIDWRGYRGIRDVLIHGYFRVDATILWKVVTEECPIMIVAIQRFLESREGPAPTD